MTFFTSILKLVGAYFIGTLSARKGNYIKSIALFALLNLVLSINSFGQSCDIMRVGTPCVGETLTFILRGPCTASSWTISMGGTRISETSTTCKVRWDSPVLNAEVGAVTDKGSAYSGYFDVKAVLHPSVIIATGDNGKCLGSTVKFTATPKNAGEGAGYNYLWKVNGIIDPVYTKETFTTNTLKEGDNVTVSWNLGAGVQCSDATLVTSDPVIMHFETFPFPNVQSEVYACPGESKSATASITKGNEIFRWYLAASGGSPVYTGKTLTYVLPDWESHDFYVANDMCDLQRSKVTFRPYPGEPISGGGSGCSPVTGTASVSSSLTVVRWEKSTNAGISWDSIPNAPKTTSYNYSFIESCLIRAVINKGTCSIPSQAATITVLKSIGGKPVASFSVNECKNIQGTITLGSSKTGQIKGWYVSSDKISWKLLGGDPAAAVAFHITDTTKYYFAKVQLGTCVEANSDTITIHAKAYAGSVKILSKLNCHSASGTLELLEKYGEVKRWEYSQTPEEANSWKAIANSANPIHSFSALSQNTSFRAMVRLINCPDSAYSPLAAILISNPPKGILSANKNVESCDSVTKPIRLKGQFKLKDYSGSIVSWEADSTGEWKAIAGTALKDFYDYKVRVTTRFRVRLSIDGCDDIFSGVASVYVNPEYKGLTRAADQIIKAYDGHSYITNGSIILSKGFKFHANSCQQFSITIDENYTMATSNENFVLTETIHKEGVKNLEDVNWLGPNDKSSEVEYRDGLGRAVQHVTRKASPQQFDLVQPIVYDASGREEYEYLPYVDAKKDGSYKEDFSVRQREFYIKENDQVANSMFPFAKKVYDGSALNLVVEQGSPGVSWQPLPVEGGGKTHKTGYYSNSETDIIKWGGDTLPVRLGNYAKNQLIVSYSIDEKGLQIKEYTDKRGLTVLKIVESRNKNQDTLWLKTYYIYNEFGRLCFLLTPEAVNKLPENLNQAFLKTWAYTYQYDDRQRMIRKRLPGTGWMDIYYDEGNRIRLTQDAEQRKKREYIVLKYDKLERPIMTAIWKDSLNLTRTQLENKLKTQNQWYEDESSGNHGYTLNRTFPVNVLYTNLLTVTYYDGYNFLKPAIFDTTGFTYSSQPGSPTNYSLHVSGLITGSKVKVLGSGAKWMRAITYYDNKYRPVQTIKENHIGGRDLMTASYDFSGKILTTVQTHFKSGLTPLSIKEEYAYDHAGRLLTRKHKIGNKPTVNMVQNNYNELGVLIEKNLHGTSTGFIQSVDYRYNIRGWLTSINNASLTTDGGITNNDLTDAFGMELKYESGLVFNPANAQFNGNIAEAIWKNKWDNKLKGYAYSYDELNRLTQAQFKTFENNNWNNEESGRYNEAFTDFDLNGNVLAIKRTGVNGYNNSTGKHSFGKMDSLIFHYLGNHLLAVKDSVPDVVMPPGFKAKDFADGVTDNVKFNINDTTTYDYAYNENGNMVKDKNKGIRKITYNLLNLVERVEFADGRLQLFTYNAMGVKLSMKLYASNGTRKDSTEYVGIFEYKGTTLQHIFTGEGRVIPTGNSYSYEYMLTDHLGNVRASVDVGPDGNARIIQTNDYYAGGMTHEGSSFIAGSENRYKYAAKEEQSEVGWIDMGARMFDSQLMRFFVTDPLAEEFASITPFNYALNNPLSLIDPTGMSSRTIYDFDGNAHTIGDDDVITIYTASESSNKSNSVSILVYREKDTGSDVVNFVDMAKEAKKLLKDKFEIWEVNDVNDLESKLKDLRAQRQVVISTFIIVSHGSFVSPYFAIGNTQFGREGFTTGSNYESLKAVGALLDGCNTVVVLTACNVAGGVENEKRKNNIFMQEIANALGSDVYGSMGYFGGSEIKAYKTVNGKNVGEPTAISWLTVSKTKMDDGTVQTSQNYAYKNGLNWMVAHPNNVGTKIVNSVVINYVSISFASEKKMEEWRKKFGLSSK